MDTNNKIVDKLSERLSRWRRVLMTIAYNAGLSHEEIARIFGTTRQNVGVALKKQKDGK